jgi:hypothetical protein
MPCRHLDHLRNVGPIAPYDGAVSMPRAAATEGEDADRARPGPGPVSAPAGMAATVDPLPGSAAGSLSADPPPYLTWTRVSSLLSSVGQESTTAVLAPFFAGTLGAAPVVIAVVEAAGRTGGAAARAGGSSVALRRPGIRGVFDLVGYVGAAVAAAFLSGAGAVWQAGACRAGAWAARGLGTPAELRPVSEAALAHRAGGRLGRERAVDALAAAAGPLMAVLLLAFASVRTVLLLAVVPAVAAGVASARGARAARARLGAGGPAASPGSGTAIGLGADGAPPRMPPARVALAQLRRSGPLGRLLIGIALYEASNIAAALLLLRAAKVLPTGVGSLSRLQAVALLYVVYQLCAAAFAACAGALAERLGAARVVAIGAVGLLVAYAGFAYAGRDEFGLMVGCFVLAGAAAGAVDAAEYVGVARLATPENRFLAVGTLIGLQNAGRVLATVTAGGLWTLVGPPAGLLICGPLLIVTAVFLIGRSTQTERLPA